MLELWKRKKAETSEESSSSEMNIVEQAINTEVKAEPLTKVAEELTPKKEKEPVIRKGSSGALKEVEFYNSLSKNDKEKYLFHQKKKKEFQVNSIFLILVLVVGFLGQQFINSELNSAIAKNQEMRAEADGLLKEISGLKKTEDLLEDVAISGLMSKAIYEQRDEVSDLLDSIEAVTPNDLQFKLNKVQKLSKDIYKVDYELSILADPTNTNKEMLDTAYMYETFKKSKEILSIANRDERAFIVQEFVGSTYSPSTKTFPMSLTVQLVEKGSIDGNKKAQWNK